MINGVGEELTYELLMLLKQGDDQTKIDIAHAYLKDKAPAFILRHLNGDVSATNQQRPKLAEQEDELYYAPSPLNL